MEDIYTQETGNQMNAKKFINFCKNPSTIKDVNSVVPSED